MALAGTGGINQIKPTEGLNKSQGTGTTGKAGEAAKQNGIDFRQALNDAVGAPSGAATGGAGAVSGLNGGMPGVIAPNAAKPTVGAGAISDLGALKAQMPSAVAPASSLKFSNHSIERMHSRGISYSPEQMKSIESAVAKAAAKGSKDTLVLTDNSALIVSVKNGTVVTVMDRAAMKENVFTNIDSTVMA